MKSHKLWYYICHLISLNRYMDIWNYNQLVTLKTYFAYKYLHLHTVYKYYYDEYNIIIL